MQTRRTEAATANYSKLLGTGDSGARQQQPNSHAQQPQQHKRASNACRELCTSCQSRIEDILHGDNQQEDNNNKNASWDERQLEIIQTTMPDYAVAMVRQKLLKLAQQSDSLTGEERAGKIGKDLSRFMEEQFGGAWNVVIGQDFAASVIYGANSFLHCCINSVNYLLFSWQPVSLFSGSTDSCARVY